MSDLIDKPLAAVATHIHYDHVGALHEFDERLMHHSEAHRMASYNEFSGLKVAAFPPAYALQDETYTDYLISAVPAGDFDPDAHRISSTTITSVLEDGDVVDLGNRHLEVLHLPGHSPGSIGLWDEKERVLFSGDALYDGQLLDDLPDSDIPDYIDTMKRLREYPVDAVHGGHEPSFGRRRMIELIDSYLASRDPG